MRIFSAIALAICLSTGAAQAATFTYSFTAESPVLQFSDDSEASLADDLWALFGPGGTMSVLTGTITFDDTLLAAGGDFDTFAPISITLDGFDTSGVLPGQETRVRDSATLDFIGTISTVTDTTPQDAVDIIWRDPTGTALGGPNPFASIDITAFATRSLLIYNPRVNPLDPSDRFSTDRVDFQITSLTPAPVPLPGGWPLLAGGLGLMLALRRRRD